MTAPDSNPSFLPPHHSVTMSADSIDMETDNDQSNAEPLPWHLGVYDGHCHPTDTVACFDKIPHMKARALTIMASRRQDQDLVAQLAHRFPFIQQHFAEIEEPRLVVPAFGWHPWFSYQIYDDVQLGSVHPSRSEHFSKVISPSPSSDKDASFLQQLPDVVPLSHVLRNIRAGLEQFPLALVGEVGLDRAFRIPNTEFASPECVQEQSPTTPGGREGRGLSPFHVSVDHQKRILLAQLSLAGEYQRAASVHGVAAHGVLFSTISSSWKGFEKKNTSKRAQKREAELKKLQNLEGSESSSQAPVSETRSLPFPPRICLHSYSGAPETLKQWLHPSVPSEIYFSFSKLVNFSAVAPKAVAVIQELPDERILVESDLHKAGHQMDDLLEEIIRIVCMIKGWKLETGVKILGANWKRFIFGHQKEPV